MNSLLNYQGRQFTATIRGCDVEGKIQVEEFWVYLCQDSISGRGCSDKLGYYYSWCVVLGTPDELWEHGVLHLKIID